MLDGMLLIYGLIGLGEFLLWRAIEAYGARGGSGADVEAVRRLLQETREAQWALGEGIDRLRDADEFRRRLRGAGGS